MIPPTSYVLPPNSLILVLGANGFIATQVTLTLLSLGYRVRGTVRSTARTQWLLDLSTQRFGPDRLSLIEIPDLAQGFGSEAAEREVLEGVSGIVHMASVTTFSADPAEVVEPSVAYVRGVLEAVKRSGAGGVKRVVLTSSCVSIGPPQPNSKHDFNATIWNEGAVEEARKTPIEQSPGRMFAVYMASKVEAERAMWDFVEKEKVGFEANAVLPGTVLGALADTTGRQSASTAGLVHSLYSGEPGAWNFLQPWWFIDVQDCARLHVAALLLPGVKGERILGFAQPFSQTEILDVLRREFPGKTFQANPEGEGRDISVVDNKRATELIEQLTGKGWTSLDQSVKDSVAHLVK